MQIPERLYPEGTPKFGWRIDEIMAWAGDHLARSDAFRNQTEIVKQLKKEHSELFNSAPYEGTIAAMRAWAKREAEKLQSLHLFEAQIKRENAWHTKAINKFNAGLLRPKSQSTPIPGPQIFNSAAPRYAQWTQEDFSLVRRLLPDWIGKNPVKVVIYDALGISGYDHESHRVLMYTEKSHGARGSRVRTRGEWREAFVHETVHVYEGDKMLKTGRSIGEAFLYKRAKNDPLIPLNKTGFADLKDQPDSVKGRGVHRFAHPYMTQTHTYGPGLSTTDYEELAKRIAKASGVERPKVVRSLFNSSEMLVGTEMISMISNVLFGERTYRDSLWNHHLAIRDPEHMRWILEFLGHRN